MLTNAQRQQTFATYDEAKQSAIKASANHLGDCMVGIAGNIETGFWLSMVIVRGQPHAYNGEWKE